MAITASESQPPQQSNNAIAKTSHTSLGAAVEVESVKCDSCGFTEDCTRPYISRVRDRHHGHWLCGLCAEAVKDEALRSPGQISAEEALNRHITFFRDFRSSDRPTEHPISAIGRIFRRSLDSPRTVRSNSSGSLEVVKRLSSETPLVRSGSCFSSLSR